MECRTWPRTDMASEAHRLWQKSAAALDRLNGVKAEEQEAGAFKVFCMQIDSEEGAKALGKPCGRYVTLELPRFFTRGDEEFSAAVAQLASLLRPLLRGSDGLSLVVGLGNEQITPDALGPAAVRQVFPTRHLKQSETKLFSSFSEVAVCTPGVLGATGIESAAQIAAFCASLKPARVIVVDALAGADPERLCRTVQLADSGIAPGSGVGNDRACLSEASLGVPVTAIGVPTVIDAALFGGETSLAQLFVTPRDIDAVIRAAGRLIGYAIDLALHPGLNFEELVELLE